MAETEQQRIDRITQEIMAGQRSFDDLRRSLDRLSGTVYQPYGTATTSDQATVAAGEAAVRERVIASFTNRGVALNQYSPVDSTATWPDKMAGALTPPQPDGSAQPNLNKAPAGGGAGAEPDPFDEDAWALVNRTLLDFGFSEQDARELADWSRTLIAKGHGAAYVLLQLREHPVFQRHFPEIKERQDRGLSPMSPQQIVQFRSEARQLMRFYGLPPGFYDSPDDFRKMIVNDWSPAELKDWLEFGMVRLASAPAEDQEIMREMYELGATPGDLLAMSLDRGRALPVLQQQFAAAQVGGAALRTGYGRLSRAEQEELAARGVGSDQATAGFAGLAAGRELYNPLPGFEPTEQAITREEQLGAAFGGSEHARERIRRRKRAREATFEGGGAFAGGKSGLEGIGSAET